MSISGTVNIGGAERPLKDADPSWVQDQLGSRQKNGAGVCVRVLIRQGDINLHLASPACGGGGGGPAPELNARARQIVDLWVKHKLNSGDLNSGHLVAFLKQLNR